MSYSNRFVSLTTNLGKPIYIDYRDIDAVAGSEEGKGSDILTLKGKCITRVKQSTAKVLAEMDRANKEQYED